MTAPDKKEYDAEVQVAIPWEPHQAAFVNSPMPRIFVRAGRRSGKTKGVSIRIVNKFLNGRRQLYATPTSDQLNRCWTSVKFALADAIAKKVFKKDETEHTIEVVGTEKRIKMKTAWNADMLRGDYADDLYLDEFQLMSEETWSTVGQPMLLDTNGHAVLLYTPPSLQSRSASKAKDPMHAAKLFKAVQGRQHWQTFHFSSRANPTLSPEALAMLMEDMSALAIRMEIDAEDVDEMPGALWTRNLIESTREALPDTLDRIAVAVDPSATSEGDEAGIVKGASRMKDGKPHLFVMKDKSKQGSPKAWAQAAVELLYEEPEGDVIFAEANNGGEMVRDTIKQVDPDVKVVLVWASRGKATRAEPVSTVYEDGRAHHVGSFPFLEDEMCKWVPGAPSPNRMDALVWLGTGLVVKKKGKWGILGQEEEMKKAMGGNGHKDNGHDDGFQINKLPRAEIPPPDALMNQTNEEEFFHRTG